MFNHKTIGTVILLAVGFAYAGGEEPESLEVKQKAGYRIEIVVDTTRYDPQYPETKTMKMNYQELQFISPKGKVIKKMQYCWIDRGRITLSPNGRFLIKAEEISAEWRETKEGKVKFSYINAKGEKEWHKVMELYQIFGPPESREGETGQPYFFKISRDGRRIVFVRTDEYKYRSDIFVFDTLGNELISISNIPYIENSRHLQIAHDGKIVGATVEFYDEAEKRPRDHLFFLDVETGRTKIVKAKGEGWGAQFSLPPEGGTPLGKVRISWGIYADPQNKKWIKGGHKYLTFDEIPEDLSTLFGGEK